MNKSLMLILLLSIAGCTVHPPGEGEERDAALREGKTFDAPLPPLPADATPDQMVRYAWSSNADLQQQYWTWRAAIEQIPQDGTQAASLNIALGTTITRGYNDLRSSSVALSNDPMSDIKWPGKLDAAARQDLENARAAGRRFAKTRNELRNKVLGAYYDYCLTARLAQLEQRNLQLLQTTASATESRNRAGSAAQEDVLKADNEVDISQNDIANMQSQFPAQRGALNALLNRPADAPLIIPADLPTTRPLVYSDDELLSLAKNRNPELAALADEIRGRGDAIRLARLQYMPDFNLSAGTDLMGITQSVLGQMTLPFFRHEALDAAIFQAQANLRVSEALRRQSGNDLASQVVLDVTTLRDADRQLELFQHRILPRARTIVDVGRAAYESGHASLLDFLDDQRSLIAVQRLVANLTIAREKRLVDLETITATDLSGRTADTTPPSPPALSQSPQ